MPVQRVLYFFSLLSLFQVLPASGQDLAPAFPDITNFVKPEQLTVEGVNDIIQDERGFMYFGVDQGILEYDGVNWRYIPVSEGIVRSLGFDKKKIYAGSVNNFGYLQADRSGIWRYIPLIDSLPANERSYGGIWFLTSTSREVVFNALKRVYILRGGQIDTLQPPTTLIHNSVFQDTMYARLAHRGLVKLAGDSLHLLPGGEDIAQKGIAAIIPLADDQSASPAHPWVLIHRTDPPSRYDGRSFRPFPLEQATRLAESHPYKGLRLPSGHLAIGTYLKGLYIYSQKGKLLFHLTRENGLIGNSIQSMFLDRDNNLWVGCRNGLSRLSFGDAVSYFDYRNGMDGRGNHLALYQGKLYTANNKGIHQLHPDGQFRPVPFVKHLSWELLESNGHLIAATTDGISWVNGPVRNSHRLLKPYFAFCLAPSSSNPQRVFYTLADSIGSIRYLPEREDWVDEGAFQRLSQTGLQLLEWPANHLWVRTDSSLTKFQLKEQEGGISVEDAKSYHTEDGFPGDIINFFTLNKQLYASGTEGLFCYNQETDRFEPSVDIPDPKTIHPQARYISKLVQGESGIYALVEPHRQLLSLKKSAGDQYQWRAFPRAHTFSADGHRLYLDETAKADQAVLWLSTQNGWLRYAPSSTQNTSDLFHAFIREFRMLPDSVIYQGSRELLMQTALRPSTATLRFSYTSPIYKHPGTTRFQYWLEGFEKNWSVPTLETTKDYTNLRHGRYTFHVRAVDLDGYFSREDSYSFVILTPWYLSWWAFVLYFLLLGSLIWGGIKSRVWYLERKNLVLEEEVRSRTVQLRQQTEKLKESEQLKTRFFANISHEFRTPLTIIGGMVEQIRQKRTATLDQNLNLIERNSNILLRLINQLLDLSKLESSQMQLHPTRDNIIGYIDYIVESFYSLAASKNIKLQFEAAVNELEMDYDPAKFLQILSNLLSNALKFTPSGGEVIVRAEIDQNTSDKPLFLMEVQDNGIGIPLEKQAYIFNHFYQVDNSSTRQGEGTGIGLALVKELIDLAGGNITVNSRPEQGTKFSVQLPISRKAEKAASHYEEVVPKLEQVPVVLSEKKADAPLLKEQEETENLPLLLIVEDNKDVVTYLRACLEEQYRIRVAENGQVGIQLATELIPDIIISDVMMPLKNGFEVCQALKSDEKTSHIPIILLTAKNTLDSRMAGLERGADAYLSKPFNERELLIRLKKLVELRRRLRERYSSLAAPEGNLDLPQEDAFITKVRALVSDRIDQAEYTIEDLCKDLAMSRMQLHRKLKALTNCSTAIFIRRIRLQQAHHLLETSRMNVSEVAYAVGFNDPKYFSRVFAKEYGKVPSEVRMN